MTIDKISVGTTVTIVVSNEQNTIEFTSIVLAPFERKVGVLNGVYLSLIRVDGRPLTFEHVKLKLHLTDNEDHREYVYHVTNIVKHTLNGESCYICFSPDDSKPINHRGAIRVPLCEECQLRIGSSKRLIECYTRDISHTGISFSFTHSELPFRIGEEFTAEFEVDGNPIQVSGKIVRTTNEEDRDIIGCQLSRSYPIIQKLVNKLQTRNKT